MWLQLYRSVSLIKVRLGVITYGRAPSPGVIGRASPLIAQIPFTDAETVVAALKAQHGHLDIGLGTATSAGGMAVLEALVAAIEVRRTDIGDYSEREHR